MNNGVTSHFDFLNSSLFRTIALALLIALVSVSCGSTKVMTADKTLVYRDAIYNVSHTSVFTRKTEAVTSDSETINLDRIDRDGFEALLEEHGGLQVRQVFHFDETEMLFQSMQVDSWKDYNRMKNRFDDAAEDLQKFLADKKKTQLKLG